MAFWLIKSEPSTWSWQDQIKNGTTHWDGVRNFQAAKNLKTMRVGDSCLFYHSGEERQIMGLVKVIKEAHPDPSDETGRFVMIEVAFEKSLTVPVKLSEIKKDERLKDLGLVKQGRLSVMPVDPVSWQILLSMGTLK
ncbi:EVE domain-containing protein [Candidatus Nucleicultrix amoebiphila]|uniref:EVE domain-containing protein n=1 Tax=Candidatus Nucleicultrix amoebiphila FS5 TaxID=1414854 RepID=A0A1W6N421_9PROT|nr:EVE domain-containing protein [Candidatus Nucleicultrix amoebiphila]ARN84498.1 hypothetical protein GQ61_03230 [Candidatus Nucleicultrix amoebiphila FS5]